MLGQEKAEKVVLLLPLSENSKADLAKENGQGGGHLAQEDPCCSKGDEAASDVRLLCSDQNEELVFFCGWDFEIIRLKYCIIHQYIKSLNIQHKL